MPDRIDTPAAQFPSVDRRQRIIDTCASLETLFRAIARDEHAPGISFGVIVDAELVFADGFGTKDVTLNSQPDADTVFRIASMTKSFTAAATLVLRDQRLLTLDSPAAHYVPELDGIRYPNADSAPVSVRDLLTMSAGWPQDDPWGDRQLHRDDAFMSSLYTQGLSFSNPPGVCFEYSNLGYMLLGRVITQISGMPAMDFVTQTLLEPLGMSSTRWARDDASGRGATGYRWEDQVWKPEPPLTNAGDVATFAGLYSTVRDLARWIGFLQSAWPPRDEPEQGPLKRSSRREMQRIWQTTVPKLHHVSLDRPAQLQSGGYGYGLAMTHNGSWRSCGHGGGLPGFGSHMRWAPDYGIGVVALANVTYANVHGACEQALRILLDSSKVQCRAVAVSPALRRAHQHVGKLLNQWDEQLAADLFADNFFDDIDHAHWHGRLDELRARHGVFRPDGEIEPENWLRGRQLQSASRGWCDVWLTLSPTMPPKVQTLRLRSVLHPPDTVSERVAAICELTRRPVRRILSQHLSNDAQRSQIWRQLKLVNLCYGGCELGALLGSDGRGWACYRLDNAHAALRVEVRFDDRGLLHFVDFSVSYED